MTNDCQSTLQIEMQNNKLHITLIFDKIGWINQFAVILDWCKTQSLLKCHCNLTSHNPSLPRIQGPCFFYGSLKSCRPSPIKSIQTLLNQVLGFNLCTLKKWFTRLAVYFAVSLVLLYDMSYLGNQIKSNIRMMRNLHAKGMCCAVFLLKKNSNIKVHRWIIN